ncbi:MAG: peptidylprolyl isomerase [Terriglobales bacterium]
MVEQLDLSSETAEVPRTGLELDEAPVAERSRSAMLRRLVREPLLHFLVAGMVLFGSAMVFERSDAVTNASRIQVSAPQIQQLREVWTRQWGRSPDSREMENLINDYVRDEVLYREALASGLDKDDTIIRRRLVEKMEFLSQELAAATPSDKDLQEYFERNREAFLIPAKIAFTHVYLSTSKRGAAAEGDASRALARLDSHGISAAQLSGLGDPFMLQSEYPLQTEQQVKELFGEEFARKLFQLEPGAWVGPFRSSYGFHLVRVLQKVPSRAPELADVRSQVLTDLRNHRLQTASEAFYAQLRRKYHVDVDNAALSAVEAQRSSPSNNFGSSEGTVPDVD